VTAAGIIINNGDGTWKMVFSDEGTLTEGTAYYYQVKATVGATDYAPTSTAPVDHSIIRIVVPYENEALVHRWLVNAAQCDLIDRGIDDGPNDGTVNGSGYAVVDFGHNYRCQYNGVSATLDTATYYYDLGHDLMVDRFEMGCNISKAACGSHLVGGTTTTDCVGHQNSTTTWTWESPEPTAPQYSIAYNKEHQSNRCYIQLGAGTTNQWFNANELTNNQIASSGDNYGSYFYTNKRGTVPHTYLEQTKAHYICQSQSKSLSVNSVGSNVSKRMLRRKENIAASLWPRINNASDINTIEAGVVPGACHSTYSGAAVYGDRDGDYNPTEDVWPSDAGAIIATGSTATANCTSRFGVQDMIGGIREFASDQFDCGSTTGLCTSKITPSVDPNSRATHLNGSDGVYLNFATDNTSNNQMSNAVSSQLISWFSSDQRGTEYINPFMGIGMICEGTACNSENDDNNYLSPSGSADNATISSFQSQSDRVYGSTTTGGLTYIGTMTMGRSAIDNVGTYTGRYTYYIGYPSESEGYNIGTRCMYQIDY
jgi:hypothetical protein